MHINVNNQDELIKGTYNNVNGYGVKSYGLSSNGVKETKVNAPLEVSFTGMMKDSINTSEIYGANKEQIDNELVRNENLAAQMAEAVNNLKEMITPEGYNALSELGIIPDEEDPQMVIGVCERIQMQLAAYCEDYKPVGLNIDKAKMAEVLGSEVFAKSVEKAMDLAYISDESKAAVIKGSKNLSIDEVYKCAHSVIGTGSTKTSNIASTMDKQNVTELAKDIIDNLKPQIERIFSKIGLEATEENMDTAMWMLRNDVPLTEENIIKAIKINEMLSLPKDVFEKVVKENISLSMYFAADVKDAYFVKNQYDVSKVAEAIDALENATEETVENILAEGKILNIANIKATLAYASTTIKTESADSQKSTASNESVVAKQARMFANAVTSKSILVTAKAVLTSTALLKMQQVGIDIDMTSLTEMIEIESATYNKMAESYGTTAEVTIEESKVSVFAETLQAREYIRSASVSIVAKVSVSDTLQSVSITAKATQAVAAYDAIGTSVRRDMGDTYTKAFSNIDELLDAIEVDKNTSTRRAARILGYNSMDITSENILKIEAVANEIDYLVDNLTPRTVSYLLANDINPLDKDYVLQYLILLFNLLYVTNSVW